MLYVFYTLKSLSKSLRTLSSYVKLTNPHSVRRALPLVVISKQFWSWWATPHTAVLPNKNIVFFLGWGPATGLLWKEDLGGIRGGDISAVETFKSWAPCFSRVATSRSIDRGHMLCPKLQFDRRLVKLLFHRLDGGGLSTEELKENGDHCYYLWLVWVIGSLIVAYV